jgi:Na+/H+-dicarboxylate symporter
MIQEVTKAKTRSDALMEFLVFVLSILISTFLLRVVWNRSLVKHISVLKPINTMLDAFILALSLQIVRGI